MDRYKDLVEVFEDTRQKSLNKFKVETETLIKNTKIYNYPSVINIENAERIESQSLSIIDCDTVTTACSLKGKYNKVAALNFADALTPGGGVLQGMTTQEENICRRSNLYESLIASKEYYNINHSFKKSAGSLGYLYTDTLIYSTDVTIFKDDDYNNIEPIKIDIITCPAPSILEYEDIFPIYKCRIRGIIRSAIANKVDCLVLGAWGCGAFGQNPYEISKAFIEVLSEIKYFKEVVFAIPSSHATNYKVFEKAIHRYEMLDREVLLEAGTVVEHFKRELLDNWDEEMMFRYQVLGTGINTADDSEIVIYKALYPDNDGMYKLFSRPIDDFLGLVDKNKYPDIKRKYVFQLI